jgi:hypothetical protein
MKMADKKPKQDSSTLGKILDGQWSKSEKRSKIASDIRMYKNKTAQAIKSVKESQRLSK